MEGDVGRAGEVVGIFVETHCDGGWRIETCGWVWLVDSWSD
jgi:hypothetical protein